jgi:hypothetical protein
MVDSIPITPHGLQMGENEKKLSRLDKIIEKLDSLQMIYLSWMRA